MLRAGMGVGVQRREKRRCLIGVATGHVALAAKGVGAECLPCQRGSQMLAYLTYFTQIIPS